MYVKPTHATVPDPERGGYLPSEGRNVEHDTYWQRRLNDGDVVESEPPAPPPDAPTALALPSPESPQTAGSSVSDVAISQPRTARKGA